MFKYLCFAALISVAFAGRLEILECTGSGQQSEAMAVELHSPQFEDGTSNPILRKGVTYDLEVAFVGSKPSATLKTRVFGEINGVPLPFNGVPEDACPFLTQGSCPLDLGRSYYYKQQLTVLPAYPATNLFIIWKLEGANGKNEVCIRLPARIVA